MLHGDFEISFKEIGQEFHCFQKNSAENIGNEVHTNRDGTLHKESRHTPANYLGGDPYGNRTHIFAVRGRRLNRLTKGPSFDFAIIPYSFPHCKSFFQKIFFFLFFTKKTESK